jgi:hypothetical protein
MHDTLRLERTGRSWKQQAHLQRYKRTRPLSVAPSPSRFHPAESWWTQAQSWAEFSAKAQAELARMSQSTFGRTQVVKESAGV